MLACNAKSQRAFEFLSSDAKRLRFGLSLRFGSRYERPLVLGVPPWSLSLSNIFRDFELAFLGNLVFRGTFGSIRPNFEPVSTNSDLFQNILPGGPDLLSPISTCFAGRT